MTIMNQSNGTVEALVGGRGNKTSDLSLNRATGTTRQPGSTFKILSAFLPALDKNHMTLATVYEDAPYNYIDTNRPVRNYYKGYKGYSTIREAITNSMNVVSAKTIADVTPKTSFEYLMNLGFSTLVSNETTSNGNVYTDITQSLSLGGLTYGVTNMELTSAYASIANGGTYQKPVLYTKVVDHNGNILLSNTQKGKRVMKEKYCFPFNRRYERRYYKRNWKISKTFFIYGCRRKVRNYFKQLRLLVQRLYSLSYSFCLDGL